MNKKVRQRIYDLRKKWNKKGFSPFSINTGSCWIFARELEKSFPEGQVLWGHEVKKLFPKNICADGHCFFKYEDKYYDSESPSGVKTPHLLKYYERDYENE